MDKIQEAFNIIWDIKTFRIQCDTQKCRRLDLKAFGMTKTRSKISKITDYTPDSKKSLDPIVGIYLTLKIRR